MKIYLCCSNHTWDMRCIMSRLFNRLLKNTANRIRSRRNLRLRNWECDLASWRMKGRCWFSPIGGVPPLPSLNKYSKAFLFVFVNQQRFHPKISKSIQIFFVINTLSTFSTWIDVNFPSLFLGRVKLGIFDGRFIHIAHTSHFTQTNRSVFKLLWFSWKCGKVKSLWGVYF